MAIVQPVWFLPRTRDSPPEFAITLGDIIEFPFQPEETINDRAPPAIEARLLRSQEQTSWSWTHEFSRSVGGGIFASFLALLGIGPEADISHEYATAFRQTFEAERLVTKYFIPNRAYIEAILQDPDVSDALTGVRRKKCVYMITGIKTVYGGNKALEVMRQHGNQLSVGFDASSMGVPVGAGVHGHYDTQHMERQKADPSNFVLGYQLRKLKFKHDKVEHKPYNKGALRDREEYVRKAKEVPNVDDMELEDVSASELGLTSAETIDESGESVAYVHEQ